MIAERTARLTVLAQAVVACAACSAARNPPERRVVGVGPLDAPLLIIGEAPGAEEEKAGEPFVGPAGQRLNIWLECAGIDRKAVRIMNTVACRPVAAGARAGTEKNRPPTPAERTTCRQHAFAQVDLVSPRVIVCVGTHAAAIFRSHVTDLSDTARVFYAVPERQTSGPPMFAAWRGQLAEAPFSDAIRLLACYHPSYAMRLEHTDPGRMAAIEDQAIQILSVARRMSERSGDRHG